MATDPAKREELEQLLRRSCREVEVRVRAGEELVSEAVLAKVPALAADAELAIDIIYTEYVTREELGHKPTGTELSTRFPQFAGRLERLLDVDAALGEVHPQSLTVVPTSTWAGDPKSITTHGPNPPSPIRRRIGQYEILQEIGRGGMGVVYRARQLTLSRIVALKVIQAAQVSPAQHSRFRTEAMAIAQLNHPNIVRVIEIGEQDDAHFISLEYAAEGSLDRKLLSGPYAIRHAAEVVETLARAVDYAHEMGIIHRDLKPANVLIATGGVLKVADFGLAKWYLSPSSEQTQSGALLGTPCYMAPEQAGSRSYQIGPTTDIYALGVILYELLVGQPPFMTDSAIETMEQIRVKEPPSPRRIRKSVPRDLETICLRCLQKDPRRRFQSAKDLADDLHRFLEHEPIQSRSIRRTEKVWRWVRRHALWASMTAAMLLMCVVGVVLGILHRQEVEELSSNVKFSKRRVKDSERIAAAAKSQADATINQATQIVDRLTREGEHMMWQPGLSDIGQNSLDQVLRYYQDLLKSVPNDVRIKRRAAQAYIVVGQYQRERGQLVAAEKNLREGIALWRELEHEFPNNLDDKLGLANAVMHLATLDRALERSDESEAHYREGTRLLNEIIVRAPDQRRYKHLQANALLNLAVPLRRRGKLVAAEQVVREAVALMWQGFEQAVNATAAGKYDKQLIPRGGALATPPTAESQVSRVLPDIDFLRQLPRTVLQVALNEGWVTQLGLGYEDLGLAWERRGHVDDAERAFEQSFEIRKLAVIYGGPRINNLEFLARSNWTMARCKFRHGEILKGEELLRESIDLLIGLEKDYPKWAAFSNSIAVNETYLGKSLRMRGLYDESEATLRRAVQRYEKLYRLGQVSFYTRFGVSEARRELGLTLHEMGRLNEAVMVMKQAVFGTVLNMHATYDLAYCLSLAPDFQYRHTFGLCPISKSSLRVAELMRRELHPGTRQKNVPEWKQSLRRIGRGNNLDRTLEALLAWNLHRPVKTVQLLAAVFKSTKRDIDRFLAPPAAARID